MDCCPPGSSVHEISREARILEWVVICFARGSSQPRDQTHVCYISCIGRWFLYHWATREGHRGWASLIFPDSWAYQEERATWFGQPESRRQKTLGMTAWLVPCRDKAGSEGIRNRRLILTPLGPAVWSDIILGMPSPKARVCPDDDSLALPMETHSLPHWRARVHLQHKLTREGPVRSPSAAPHPPPFLLPCLPARSPPGAVWRVPWGSSFYFKDFSPSLRPAQIFFKMIFQKKKKESAEATALLPPIHHLPLVIR